MISGLQNHNQRAAFVAFVLGACAVTWVFFANVTQEDEWRGFVVTWVRQIPLPLALAMSAVTAALAWMATAAMPQAMLRGAMAGLVTVVVSSYIAVLATALISGHGSVFDALFFGTLFHILYLTLPETWAPLLALPIIGVFASAWARQVD